MNTSNITKACANLAKTAVAGALIASVAWAVGVFEVDGSVQESHADLFDLRSLNTQDPVETFARELEALGHPEPRTYEINGNITYFSVRTTDESPTRVLETYQKRFKQARLNDRVYTELRDEENEARLVTALTGGLVPHAIESNHVTMGGMITRGKARNAEEVRRDFFAAQDPNLFFRGHRWIEAFREPDDEKTTVIASWSDDAFLYGRMHPTELRVGYGAGADDKVPACPGCVRINRMRDLTDGERFLYESNVYVTNHSPAQIVDFYKRSMRSRGWSEHPNNDIFFEVQSVVDFEGRDADVIAFKRQDRIVKLVIYQKEASTYVHAAMTPDTDPE